MNLAYRWFYGLSIEDRLPDHSAFSRARNERFRDSGIFRRIFERVVEACIAADLVEGEGFAVDACLIAADANPETASRAMQEYLATPDDARPYQASACYCDSATWGLGNCKEMNSKKPGVTPAF